MKNITKKTIALICVITLTSGCAVKQDDTTATKVLKHTANAPAYVVAGVGIAATLAVQGALIGTAKILGVDKRKQANQQAAVEDTKSTTDTATTDIATPVSSEVN